MVQQETTFSKIHSIVRPHLINSFIINRATERCPVLSDILMLCFSESNPEHRQASCLIHKQRLDQCVEYELEIE